MITQERLKELYHYCPDTGAFTSKVKRGPVKAGRVASALNDDGYPIVTIAYKKYRQHRLAFLYMEGEIPAEVDHINGDRADNRWCNLREVSRVQNSQNARRNSRNTSGVTGVSFHKHTGKWKVAIRAQGKNIHLGVYEDFFEAVCARKSAENRHGFHPNHGRVA